MRIRVFKNKDVLQQMLEFRKAGLTLKALSEIFDCDFSTIYHHCTKYNIEPEVTLCITSNLISKISPKHILYIELPEEKYYINELGIRINKGKSYQDYLKDYEIRSQQTTQ